MATMNEKLLNLLSGTHVMGSQGLQDYHSVQAVKKAMRRHQPSMRYVGIRNALKNYRLLVNQTIDWKVVVVNLETGKFEVL